MFMFSPKNLARKGLTQIHPGNQPEGIIKTNTMSNLSKVFIECIDHFLRITN